MMKKKLLLSNCLNFEFTESRKINYSCKFVSEKFIGKKYDKSNLNEMSKGKNYLLKI